MPEPPGFLTLEEAARRVGHYHWLERRLFEVLGGWVATTPEPEVKVGLEAHAARHAWHAEVWAGLVPRVAHLDPAALARPPTDELVAFVDALAGAGSTAVRLAGAYRVALPHLVATYTAHLDACGPVADGPVIRGLRLVLADEEEDRREGERWLGALASPADEAARAAEHAAHLSALLERAGGVTGPEGPKGPKPPPGRRRAG